MSQKEDTPEKIAANQAAWRDVCMAGAGRPMTTDELMAEVARLTAQGKELRDALRKLAPLMVCRDVDAPEVKRIIDSVSTPAGSDAPLRRVRAEAFREAERIVNKVRGDGPQGALREELFQKSPVVAWDHGLMLANQGIRASAEANEPASDCEVQGKPRHG